MSFNVDKCFIINFSNQGKRLSKPTSPYSMENSVLQTNNENPYLGVHLQKHLPWAAHVNQITGKANQTLGFVRRNLKSAWNSSKRGHTLPLFDQNESMLVPYGPLTKTTSKPSLKECRRKLLALCQYKRTTQVSWPFLPHWECHSYGYGGGWDTLEKRRDYQSLCLMYKIHSNSIDIPQSHIPSSMLRSTRGQHRLQQPRWHKEVFQALSWQVPFQPGTSFQRASPSLTALILSRPG